MAQITVDHLITGLGPGGAETFLARLAPMLAKRQVAGRVISLLEPGPMAEPLRAAGIEVLGLGMRRGMPSPAALWRLAEILRRRPPDALQTWLYHADLLGLLGMGLSRLRRPVAWNLRCSYMDFSRYGAGTRLAVRACAALSARPTVVVANSRAGFDHHLALGYRPRRFEVIPNGFDLEALRPDEEARAEVRRGLGLEPGDILAGLAARFDPMKDHETFCAAAGMALAREPRLRFVLLGQGAEGGNPELARMVRQAGIGETVHLLGHRQDAARIFAALDLSVCSSRGEGFPNVVAEAMACGVPCAVTDVGDAKEIVGDTGIVAPPENPAALAEAMVRLAAMEPGARQALGLDARQRIAERYSLAACADAYAALYGSITNMTISS